MIYLLDTNAITDWLEANKEIDNHLQMAFERGDTVSLCPPIHYEIERGLLSKNLTRKLRVYRAVIAPRLEWFSLTDADWIQATQFWVNARQKGRQIADIDVLLAAVAHRLNAVIVSSDADFDALPIKRENWRDSSRET